MTWTQEEIDACVARLELDGQKVSTAVQGRAFVDGSYVPATSGEWLTSSNPATNRVVAQIAACDKVDVDKAVKAARRAFEQGVWSDKSPEERKDILLKFASLIEEHTLELAVLDSVEAGKIISDNLEADVPGTAKCFRYHAEAINKVYDHVAPTGPKSLGLIVREPVGVVGLIVPWNFPLLMAAWKLAPALATGNSVVLKPAEFTSLSAIKLGELANQAGIPPGVFNVIPGLGHKAGAAIAEHMDIDMVGFTGSTVTGRKVLAASAASNLKRVSLELGGKSPQVVFADADLETAVENIMSAAFWNQSENCSCGSRLIVHKDIKAKLLEKMKEAAMSDDWKVGDPLQLSSKCGAMISPQHCEKVLGYIAKAREEGAECVLGGERILESTGGDFVGLTIFDKVTNDMTLAKEEVFGPVLSVLEFDTELEAILTANNTTYGLAASVYTTNIHRAMRVSRKLQAGNVSVNCFAEGDDSTPFGGYRQSGFVGRDKSIFAHEQYQEIKTIWYQIDE